MNELKVYVKPIKTNMFGKMIVGQSYYLKSESDKVIAELEDDVTYWKKVAKKNMDDNVTMAKQRLEAFKREGHHKYKRCLAMAKWCNSEMGRETFACFRPRHTKEVWREEHKYWAKWRKIWFELYKKFKEEN